MGIEAALMRLRGGGIDKASGKLRIVESVSEFKKRYAQKSAPHLSHATLIERRVLY